VRIGGVRCAALIRRSGRVRREWARALLGGGARASLVVDVRFLIIGGVGAWLHGAQRPTADLDVCVEASAENTERLTGVLSELDAVLRLAPELGDVEVRANPRLLGEFTGTHWRTRAGDISVLTRIRAGAGGGPIGYAELRLLLAETSMAKGATWSNPVPGAAAARLSGGMRLGLTGAAGSRPEPPRPASGPGL
jgi:hypothetical protein